MALAMAMAAVFALALSAVTANATTYTVNTLNDSSGNGDCSLRDAINAANGNPTSRSTCTTPGSGNDTIKFSVPGTITLGSTLPAIANTAPNSLTINGSGQSITVNGNHAVEVMVVNSGATLSLANLTIADGNSALLVLLC